MRHRPGDIMTPRQIALLLVVVVYRIAARFVVVFVMSFVNDALMVAALMNVMLDACAFVFVVVMTYETPRCRDRRAIERRIEQFIGEPSCAR